MEPETPVPPPACTTATGFALPPLAGVCAFAPLAGVLGRASQGTLTWYAAAAEVGLAVGLVGMPVGVA